MSVGYRAALFDLFGTLVHFETAALPEVEVDGRRIRSTSDAWAGLLADAVPGVQVADFMRAVMAVSAELDRTRRAAGIEFPSRERFRRALGQVGCREDRAAELAPLLARTHMRRLASTVHFPEAHAELLARVRMRCRLAVITNFDDTATAYEILTRHGILPHLGSVVVSESVGLRKPHPALVRLALRDLEVAPDAAVMIGDHPVEDVGAATAAGVDAVWLDAADGGMKPDCPPPRYVVRTLSDVERIL